MSWKDMLSKNSNKIETKTHKKKVNDPVYDNTFDEDVESEFNYKYGDKILHDICSFYEECEHDAGF